MKKLEKLEQEIEALSPQEAAEFRAWYLEHDWKLWYHQLERNAEAGKLDSLARDAIKDYEAGQTSEL